MARAYASNQEYFDELAALAARMEERGNFRAAAEIRLGIRCINGLTDGWGLLMKSLEKVITQHRMNLPSDQLKDLESSLETARRAVFRQ